MLQDLPEQNYLSQAARISGFVLYGIVACLASVSALWIVRHREHQVLKAAQPHFLVVLCVGTIIFASSILTMSFDENQGVSEKGLSKLCRTTPWLIVVGYILMYGSLFSKVRVQLTIRISVMTMDGKTLELTELVC